MPRSPILLALTLILACCASSTPKLYTLELRPGPVRSGPVWSGPVWSSTVRSGAPHVVTVRSFGIPRYLERQEIVRGAGPDRLAASDDDWWAEPLRVMLRRVMVDDLAQRLPNADVVADGVIAAHPDAEIQIELQRFEWDGGAQVILIGYAATEGGGRTRTMERLRISVPVAGSAIRDQVDAMSAALAQAADVLAARLAP